MVWLQTQLIKMRTLEQTFIWHSPCHSKLGNMDIWRNCNGTVWTYKDREDAIYKRRGRAFSCSLQNEVFLFWCWTSAYETETMNIVSATEFMVLIYGCLGGYKLFVWNMVFPAHIKASQNLKNVFILYAHLLPCWRVLRFKEQNHVTM